MSREELTELVHSYLSKDRFHHVLRVEETALELSDIYEGESEKISIAALLHDIMKEQPDKKMREYIISETLSLDLIDYGNGVWHGPIASDYAHKELEITNHEILRAIHDHTWGSPIMSLTEKIVFAADKVEPARDYPGIEELRNLAYNDIDQHIGAYSAHQLDYLLEKRAKIYPKAIPTYNYWHVERSGGEE